MPCNAVTQQTAKAAVSTALLLDNPTAIEALTKQLEALFQAPVIAGGQTWQQAYYGRHNGQRPYAELVGGQSLFFGSETASAEVRRNGEIVLRNGWISYTHKSRPEELQAKLTQVVNAINGLLFQAQVRNLIAQQARITGEQRTSNGALVLNVEI